MKVYLDASFLVPLFVEDDWTERARAWAITEPEVVVSDWSITEFASAVSLHVRRERLDPDERDKAENTLSWWLAGRVEQVSIDPEDVLQARLLIHRHGKLRAPDALHLAIVHRLGCALVTYDDDMAEAARRDGITVIAP